MRTTGLTIAAFGLAAASGCGIGDPCGNEVRARVPAPDAAHVAFVFERGCGATTGTSTQVSVLRANQQLRERPSFLVPTTFGNALILAQRHGPVPIGVEWIDARRVRLMYYPGLETSVVSEDVEGVTVEHVRAGEVRDNNELQRTRPAQGMEPRR